MENYENEMARLAASNLAVLKELVVIMPDSKRAVDKIIGFELINDLDLLAFSESEAIAATLEDLVDEGDVCTNALISCVTRCAEFARLRIVNLPFDCEEIKSIH